MKKIAFSVLATLFMFNLSVYSQKKSATKVVKFEITTDYGKMKGILYNETPKHRDNFVKLANEGYYDGTLFHRVIQGFIIQGGNPDTKNIKFDTVYTGYIAHFSDGTDVPQYYCKIRGMGDPGYTIPAEFNKNLIHKKGALAAARTENPEKASSGSQFYIVQGKPVPAAQLGAYYTKEQKKIYKTIGGTPRLDNDYTVFGEITQGLDVIDKIAAVKTGRAGSDLHLPFKDVKMTIKILN